MAHSAENTEKEIVVRLNGGDGGAFDELYWKYYQPVFRNAVRLLKNKEAAEDVVQEVFLLLWQNRQNINPGKSVAGWLMVTSYNAATKALKKKLRESIGLYALPNVNTVQEDKPDVHELQLEVLEKAIENLSPQKKKVFELCKLRGKTYEETAKELNISHHTVKEYLSEAIASIKSYVQQHPDYGKMGALTMMLFVMGM